MCNCIFIGCFCVVFHCNTYELYQPFSIQIVIHIGLFIEFSWTIHISDAWIFYNFIYEQFSYKFHQAFMAKWHPWNIHKIIFIGTSAWNFDHFMEIATHYMDKETSSDILIPTIKYCFNYHLLLVVQCSAVLPSLMAIHWATVSW